MTNEINALYFQSGGPTAVINSSFYGVLKEMRRIHGAKLYVSPYGIQGLIDDKIFRVEDHQIPPMFYRPGAYWGSLRRKLPEDPKDPLAEKIVQNLLKNNITYVFPNGGNDSMDTCYKLNMYLKARNIDHIKIVGIPKTVDNDLPLTDHTPGFGSAAKFVANAIVSIAIDDLSYQKGRINIVEVMGRDSGFLTAASLLALLRGYKPDFIYVPEVAFDIEDFLAKAKKCYDEKGRCLVVISEGIRDKEGKLISADGKQDVFGNNTMGGVSHYLSALVDKEGYKTRAIELSLLQRSASFLASKTDIKEAARCGQMAVRFAHKGITSCMVGMKRIENHPYRVVYEPVPIQDVVGKIVTLPKKYINASQDNIELSYLDYVLPLIKGKIDAVDECGLLKIY